MSKYIWLHAILEIDLNYLISWFKNTEFPNKKKLTTCHIYIFSEKGVHIHVGWQNQLIQDVANLFVTWIRWTRNQPRERISSKASFIPAYWLTVIWVGCNHIQINKSMHLLPSTPSPYCCLTPVETISLRLERHLLVSTTLVLTYCEPYHLRISVVGIKIL